MKWLKRDFITKFAVITVIFIAIIVSMNIVETLDKYVNSSDNTSGKSGYSYEEAKSLCYTKKIPDSNLTEVREEYYREVKQDIEKFFESIPDFKGNVTIPLIDVEFNNGMDVCSNIIISFNEKLPYIIDRKDCKEQGIYIGNAYKGYWKDGKVIIETDECDVAGIISSDYLQLCTDVYIPYDYISEETGKTVIMELVNKIVHRGGIPVYFSSEKQEVVESDIALMEEWNKENGIFTVSNMSEFDTMIIEEEKKDTLDFYRYLKNVLCIISFAFCIAAVFETIRLYISRKKKDIMILWSLGSKKSVILKMILKELGLAVIIGAVLAFAAEWIIYGMIMGFWFASVVMYGVCALLTVILITVMMITVMLLFTLRKPVITVIKSGE